MPRPPRPALMAVVLGAAAAAGGLWPAAGQEPADPPAAADRAREPDPAALRDGFDGLTFPTGEDARDARQLFEAVQDYLARKNPPWDEVCRAAQRLLDADGDYFYRARGADPAGQYRSIKAAVGELIGGLPADGRQFYQLTYGPAAEAALADAVRGGYDQAKLADCGQRYFHTAAGGRAALLLATLQLEAGRYAEAAFGFERLLARSGSADLLTPRALWKAAVAFRRAGGDRYRAAADRAWDRLAAGLPAAGLAIGRRTFTRAELRAELDRPVGPGGGVGDDAVTGRYGDAARSALAAGGTPFLDPAFQFDVLAHLAGLDAADGAAAVRDLVADGLRKVDRGKGQVPLPGFFPVTVGGRVIARGYDRVYALATRGGPGPDGRPVRPGEVVWASMLTAGGLQNVLTGHVMAADAGELRVDPAVVQQWWGQWSVAHPELGFDNAQVGSLAHDGRLVYLVDDIGLPPPPQAYPQGMVLGGLPPPPGGSGLQPLTECSRLLAVEADTGRLAWRVGGLPGTSPADPAADPAKRSDLVAEGAVFLGPPLAVGGKLYVLFERDQQIHLMCVDPHRVLTAQPPGPPPAADGGPPDPRSVPANYPELQWVQKLGSPNVRVTQDPLRRTQPAYLAYADGVLVCPTNSGAVIAVDLATRRLLWARGYATAAGGDPAGGNPAAVPPAMRRFVRPQPVAGPVPNDRWRAAAPIIAGGRVVVTAYDSTQVQCLDLRTGDLVWADDRRADDLYVGGVVGGRVVVVGKDAMRAYELAGAADGKPAVAWQNLRIGPPCGHGVGTRDGLYYLPLAAEPDRPDQDAAQVWAVDVARGAVAAKTAFRPPPAAGRPADPRLVLGNLAFHDGQLISQSPTQVSGFPLIEAKKREMDRRLAADPSDPAGLVDRGELHLDEGQLAAAVADFKAAERNGPPPAVARRLRDKLFQAYTELARRDFAAAEPMLGEFERLCQVAADGDDPADRRRAADETARRTGLFLSLVADGRERQGRAADAFRAYRAFAAVGDGQLVPVADPPGGLARPDVWARGRMAALLRTAPPAARAAVDALVADEWAAVRAADDPVRLRAFVRLYGTAFAAGREAALALADRLAAAGTDDAARDAQVVLMQLRATADDPPTQARALAAQADLLTRRGLLADAVGLYAELAARYPDVPVGDGRTGAEVYQDLVTDKRMVPYLEPPRGAAAGGYRLDIEKGQTNQPGAGMGFALTPDGHQLPFFRRHALTLEPNGTTWQLRVTDKATGDERVRFADLAAAVSPAAGGLSGASATRVAQAAGHLLLVTLGQSAYCFDLADNRKLWEYDLFKKSPLPGQQPPQVQPAAGNPDEIEVRYEDGWVLRLGRAAVLQPTYAALLTRDGLTAVDPVTGQELWQRPNVPARAQVFGDARHVFLIEATATGTRTRVLRAADGSEVGGVPDFGNEFAGPGRLAVAGRHLLLADGGPATPRAVRLYDPLTGADVWRRELPAGAVVLRTLTAARTGFVTPAGRVEVLDVATGATTFAAAVDPDRADDHLRADGRFAVTDPLLVDDGRHYFVFLNRKPDAGVPVFGGVSALRTVPVNGPAYAFDKATGRRLWYADRLFANQQLVVERFDDLPVLVAANQVFDPATGAAQYVVAVVDKSSGRLKHYEPYPQSGLFMGMVTDPKTKAVELWRYDLRLRILPTD